MVARVPVSLVGKSYESIVGNEILSRTGEFVREILSPGSCAVVTDSNVGPLYAPAVARSLQGAGFTPIVITVPAGEGSKSLAIAEEICDRVAVMKSSKLVFDGPMSELRERIPETDGHLESLYLALTKD